MPLKFSRPKLTYEWPGVSRLLKTTIKAGIGIPIATLIAYGVVTKGSGTHDVVQAQQEGLTIDSLQECRNIYGEHAPGRCMRPNWVAGDVQISQWGTLNPRFPKEKDANEIRAVALGGSTTAGRINFDNACSYPNSLEHMLNETPGLGDTFFRVVNMGISGQSSKPILDKFIHEMLPLDPDMILIYSGWNDFKGCGAFSPEDQEVLIQYFHSGDEQIVADLHPWFAETMDHWRLQRTIRVAEVEAFVQRGEAAIAEYIQTGDEQLLQRLGPSWFHEEGRRLQELRTNDPASLDAFLQERSEKVVTSVDEMEYDTFRKLNFHYRIWMGSEWESETGNSLDSMHQLGGVDWRKDFPMTVEEFAQLEWSSPYSTMPIERNEYTANIRRVIEIALENGIQPIILTQADGFACGYAYDHTCDGYTASIADWAGYHIDALQPHLERMGEEFSVPVLDVFSHFNTLGITEGTEEKCEYWDGEAVHPNCEGYEEIARFIYSSVLEQGRVIMEQRTQEGLH